MTNNKINIRKLLEEKVTKGELGLYNVKGDYVFKEVHNAVIDICKQVLDLAAEEAELNYGEDEGQSIEIDKNSILKIKERL